MKKVMKKGFTLVELIIVISIIAVLASLAFMALSGETAQARDSKRLADIKVFEDSIATSNGKNKKIDYNNSTDLSSVPDNYGTVTSYSLTTSSGVLVPLRGSYLVAIQSGIFDSDVIPTIPRDPKGAPYYGAFLSSTDYQIFGTQENPDTKQPTAIVKGSFKEGAIIDILMADMTIGTTTFNVANSRRFIAGDVIKIDSEALTVVGFNTVDGTVTTGASTAIHNKGAAIKLKTSVAGGDSLVCLGTALATASVSIAGGAQIANAAAYQANMTSTATGVLNNVVGVVCSTTTTTTTTAGPLLQGGFPSVYKVSAE